MKPALAAAMVTWALLAACNRQAPAAANVAPTTEAHANDAPSNDAPAASYPSGVSFDLFKLASPDAWTGIRGSGGTIGATARLTPARDAALVTWQDFGQIWCGMATPEAQCKGGRSMLLIVRPQALPAAQDLGDKDTPIDVFVNGRPALRHAGPNFGPGIEVRGDVNLLPSQLDGFQFLIDYRSQKALRRELRRCRTIEVRVLGRSFRFACDLLPDDV